MLFTQQIIHSLHRIKGTQRHFNENSVPVTQSHHSNKPGSSNAFSSLPFFDL